MNRYSGILWLCMVLLFTGSLVTGCSGKPSEGTIKKLFIADIEKSGMDKILEINTFSKTNGFEQDKNTYIADVGYDIVFKVGARDLDKVLGQDALMLSAGLALTYGDFKAGDTQHREQKITLIKTENGWRISSIQ
jgi:hypothetical protein